ncbi:MAG: NAD(P)/FAD-dependent oxidoreductase [Methanomassiliicoccales archaeon]
MSNERKRILILGAGFAGISAAKRLASRAGETVDVLVVSDKNYHLFTPLIYQVASGLASPYHVIQPVRYLARKTGFSFMEAKVTGIDAEARKVRTDKCELDFDFLIIGVGSVSNDFGIKGASEHALFLKTLDDGARIRNELLKIMEEISVKRPSEEEMRRALAVVIVGGGATGVELAGSLADYILILSHLYPEIDVKRFSTITLLEADKRLLPGLDEKIASATSHALERKGVKIITGAKVEEVDGTGVKYSNGRLDSNIIIWTAGIKPNPLVENLDVDHFPKTKGRITTDSYLRVKGHENIFAAGDIIWVNGASKQPPATAAAAAEEGEYIGELISGLIEGKEKGKPFIYKDRGFMLSLGRFSGVAWFPSGILLTGFIGWAIWRFVHLALIETVRSKIGILFDWTLAIFYRRITIRTDYTE